MRESSVARQRAAATRQHFTVAASADSSRRETRRKRRWPPAAHIYPSMVALRRRPLTIRVSFNLIWRSLVKVNARTRDEVLNLAPPSTFAFTFPFSHTDHARHDERNTPSRFFVPYFPLILSPALAIRFTVLAAGSHYKYRLLHFLSVDTLTVENENHDRKWLPFRDLLRGTEDLLLHATNYAWKLRCSVTHGGNFFLSRFSSKVKHLGRKIDAAMPPKIFARVIWIRFICEITSWKCTGLPGRIAFCLVSSSTPDLLPIAIFGVILLPAKPLAPIQSYITLLFNFIII